MKKSASSTNTLLLDEHPLILLPGLAKAIGLNEAIVLQQVHFLLGMKAGGRMINGQKWVWNTLDEWRSDHFPFFSVMTLRRTITGLEKRGVLISCQPDGRMSRKKYYRIDHDKLMSVSRCVQNEQMEVSKLNRSKTETPHRDYKSKESKETAVPTETAACDFSSDSPDIDATWRPSKKRNMTKEQLLGKIRPPADYPSEDEFNDYLEAEGCDNVLSTRDLYSDLCLRKWHHWKPAVKRWTEIRDWQKYVVALEGTMQEAKTR